MRTIAIVFTFLLCFASLGSALAANNKVDICHYQEENDSWKLISVGQPAAGAHLEHHDDALPGGTTTQTGTVLDADCVEVAVTCPCEGASNPTGTVTWNDQFLVIRCFVSPDSIAVTDGTLKLLEAHGPSVSAFGYVCEMVDLNGQNLTRLITEEEFGACAESIRQIALNDGVVCPE